MKYQPPFESPGSDDPYVNGDPSISREGSIPPAEAIEYPQREIVHFIEKSGFTPSDGDLYQLTRSARAQFVNWALDTGSANAMSVSLDPALQAYKQGMPLRVLVSQNNTGPTTINVNGLGARPVKRVNGAELVAGDIRAAGIADMIDDGTVFQLINFLGAVSGTINNYTIDIPYAEDSSGVANTVIASFSPAITSPQPGDLILVKLAHENTDAVNITVNALAAKPIRRTDGQPLQARDHAFDEVVLLEYHTTYWQMMHLVRSQVYMKLEADLLLWVRTDGNDANNGSSNDAAHAFRTIQGAVNFVAGSFLIGGRHVTIRLGIPGTYQASVTVINLPGTISIYGDMSANGANRASYIVRWNPTGPNDVDAVMSVAGSGSTVDIAGITFFNESTVYASVAVLNGATVTLGNCRFTGNPATTSGSDISGGGNSTVRLRDYIDFYRNISSCLFLSTTSNLQVGDWFTLITTNNITFVQFIFALSLTSARFSGTGCGFAGTAFGSRYKAIWNSVIIVDGAGPNRLPGSTAGSVDPSSVYA